MFACFAFNLFSLGGSPTVPVPTHNGDVDSATTNHAGTTSSTDTGTDTGTSAGLWSQEGTGTRIFGSSQDSSSGVATNSKKTQPNRTSNRVRIQAAANFICQFI